MKILLDVKDYSWKNFLKANSSARSKLTDWQFCIVTCVKNDIKTCKTRKNNFVKLRQIHEISDSFSYFELIGPKFAQVLKYFAQLRHCMIAGFRNSVAGTVEQMQKVWWGVLVC